MGRFLRRTLDGLYLGAGWLAGAFLVAIFLIMLFMSAGRPLGLNIPSGTDFASWCMAATAFLGLAHTFKSGEMIRVGLVIDRFTGRTRHVIEILSLAVGTAIVLYFTWFAVRYTYQSWKVNDLSTDIIVVPLWIPQLGYSGGLVILAIAFVDEFVRVLRGLTPTYHREPPKTAEEVIERAIASGV